MYLRISSGATNSRAISRSARNGDGFDKELRHLGYAASVLDPVDLGKA
jgi:hypothetical protein